MASIDRLPLPFASWQEGLFALADGLSDPAREKPLFEALSKQAPEAADLYLLLSVDGDYGDTSGPIGEHWYWTGEGVADAVIFPDAIDRAQERGDHALCDMLIACWTVFCTLFHQAPLPDLVGLAKRINALPADYRSSTYAVLALLKREAAAIHQVRRDMDALLSGSHSLIRPRQKTSKRSCETFFRPSYGPSLTKRNAADSSNPKTCL